MRAPSAIEEAAEILDVRLAGGMADDRLALGEHRRHDRVLGAHHRRLVEVHALADEACRAQVVGAVDLHLDAELGKGVDVRVEAPASDHVAAGRRHDGAPEPREQRAGEQERGADLAAEVGIELGLRDPGAVDAAPRSGRPTTASAPRSASSSTITSTSRMRGRFVSRTSSEASTVAARIGSAPFLFPDARIVPESGRPPWMTNDCMRRALSYPWPWT